MFTLIVMQRAINDHGLEDLFIFIEMVVVLFIRLFSSS